MYYHSKFLHYHSLLSHNQPIYHHSQFQILQSGHYQGQNIKQPQTHTLSQYFPFYFYLHFNLLFNFICVFPCDNNISTCTEASQ